MRALLTAERSALNLLCHLSGVATLTRAWVDAVAGTGARVRDTRKTTPGLRALEKHAVRMRRRRQPPDVAVGRRARQGQPRGRGRRRRRGLRARPRARSRACRSRSSATPSSRCARCSRPAPTSSCSTTWTTPTCARAVALCRERGRADRGVRRAVAGRRPGRRRDRRRLPRRRRPDALARPCSTSASTCAGGLVLLAVDIGNTNTVLGRLRGRARSSAPGGSRPTRGPPPTSWCCASAGCCTATR